MTSSLCGPLSSTYVYIHCSSAWEGGDTSKLLRAAVEHTQVRGSDGSLVCLFLQSEVDFHDPLWEGISDEGKEVILSLLQKDPKRRPSAGKLQQHPWFKKILGQEVLD